MTSKGRSSLYSFTIFATTLTGYRKRATCNFTASGPESIYNLTMTISEQVGKTTSTIIGLPLTAPFEYSSGFDAAQTHISVVESTTDPVRINNANWSVRSGSLLELTLVSKAGQGIGAIGALVIGLSTNMSRISGSAGSANLTVNGNDDATRGYQPDQ